MSVKTAILLLIVFWPAFAWSQLREFEITAVQSNRVPVFRDHPQMAAVVVQSSLPNLQFESNLGLVAILGDASQGEYILIVQPARQIVRVYVAGFQQGRITVAPNAPRQVLHYTVEPKDRIITDRGNLIIRTDPAGANVSIDGFPGEFRTPYVFENLIAVTHTIRIRMDGYRTEERLVRVEASRPNIESYRLTPTFGLLRIPEPDLEFHVRSSEDLQEYRITYTAGETFRQPVGRYTYRLVKPFHRPVADSLDLKPGAMVELKPRFEPDFSTLRVRANTPSVRLSSKDNRAPESTMPGIIHLETGIREVLVEAEGHAPMRLRVRSVPGLTQDTTLTLMTTAQAEAMALLESMPKGVLHVTADLDAEIWLNGRSEGHRQATWTLIPGTYDVELRHPIQTRRLHVNVPSADVVHLEVHLRPSRQTAWISSVLIPGAGLIYTGRNRGYIYMASAASGLGFALAQQSIADLNTHTYRDAMIRYRAADNDAEATLYRNRALAAHRSANQATTRIGFGLGFAAGVHLFQLADVLLTSPAYGYRAMGVPMDVNLSANGIHLTYRFP